MDKKFDVFINTILYQKLLVFLFSRKSITFEIHIFPQ